MSRRTETRHETRRSNLPDWIDSGEVDEKDFSGREEKDAGREAASEKPMCRVLETEPESDTAAFPGPRFRDLYECMHFSPEILPATKTSSKISSGSH